MPGVRQSRKTSIYVHTPTIRLILIEHTTMLARNRWVKYGDDLYGVIEKTGVRVSV